MRLLFPVILAGSFWSCSAQISDVGTFIHQKGDSLYKSSKVPGIFVGVLHKGVARYFNFGYANPDKKMPFDSATIFEAGSITKTFTAFVLVSVLKEKGISENQSILGYLPDSVQGNKALEKISFLNLLNHTSGLPRLPDNMSLTENAMSPYDRYKAGDLFSYLRTAVPKPDGKSNYSNLGMGLAGVLAERISGKRYAVLLDEYIFLPFHLVTPANALANAADNKSQGYFGDDQSAYWNMDVMAPAGGLKCSAKEMLGYLKEISAPSNAAIKPIVDTLLQPTVRVNERVSVGRAWHTLENKNKPVVYWHNGGTYGFSTFAAFLKGGEEAVIVVVNQFNTNKVSDGLGMAIMNKLIELNSKP